MLIPCIDLQSGRAVQLVHGRERRLAVDDVLGLLDKFGGYPLIPVIDLAAALRKAGKRLGRPRKFVDAARIAPLRAQGLSWAAIAEQLGIGEGTAYRTAHSS